MPTLYIIDGYGQFFRNYHAIRTPMTEAGRSISTATVPWAMSVPISSMCRAFTDTIAASDVMMYQVRATAL